MATPKELAENHGYKLFYEKDHNISLESEYLGLKIIVSLDDVNDESEVSGAVKGVIDTLAQIT